jgi:hypothetical protein
MVAVISVVVETYTPQEFPRPLVNKAKVTTSAGRGHLLGFILNEILTFQNFSTSLLKTLPHIFYLRH